MRHLLDGVREIQSSFHYAKKLLIKTSFSLLTIVLQGIGLLWPLILKRCLIEIDCVCVFYSPPPPPLPAPRSHTAPVHLALRSCQRTKPPPRPLENTLAASPFVSTV